MNRPDFSKIKLNLNPTSSEFKEDQQWETPEMITIKSHFDEKDIELGFDEDEKYPDRFYSQMAATFKKE